MKKSTKDVLNQIDRIHSSISKQIAEEKEMRKPRPAKEVRDMTEEELERERQQNDRIYHFMKEEQLSGRRID